MIILHQDRNLNERNSEEEADAEVRELLHQEPDVPLFLREGAEGKKGDAQDEKDKTGE